MIEKVLVLGGGSAGLLAALTLKQRIPELAVTVVHSRELGVIGVGESTTATMPRHLHGELDIDPGEFFRSTRPTWKLGIRFLWGPRPFFDYTFGLQMDWKWNRLSRQNGHYCDEDCDYLDVSSALMSHKMAFVRKPSGDPMIGRNYGYHIDNPRFVAFLEMKAVERGIVLRDDRLNETQQDEHGITGLRLVSGETLKADLYLDCSGFGSLLLGKALAEPYVSYRPTLFCDRAVVGFWPRTDEIINPYTTAETMDAGWCWQIEHQDMVNRGYVFCSAFLDDAQADEEFRAKNPRVSSTRIVPFLSGRYERVWVGKVVALGNAAGFVEPLESSSLSIISDTSRLLAECLSLCNREPTPTLRGVFNRINARAWDSIRDFLGLHYKFNTRLDTPFWRECRANVELGPMQSLVDYYHENGPNPFGRTTLIETNGFCDIEGYLVMLVGQKVPYQRKFVPSDEERRIWNGIRAEHRAQALSGMSVRQALNAIASPTWQWTPGYFRDASVMTPNASRLTSFSVTE